MAIRKIDIEVNGMPHTVQVNDADANAAELAQRFDEKSVKPAANKARTPRNKAKKPSAKPADPPSGVEDASDPSASE